MERLREALSELIGLQCFSAIASVGGDFAFALHAGERQRRVLRLANPNLSFLERTFEGSHSLLVECTWRIEGPKTVLCSCLSPDEARQDALTELERKITAFTLDEPSLDLTVAFEDGYKLRCFTTEADEKSKRTNWMYAWPGGVATVWPISRLTLETMDLDED